MQEEEVLLQDLAFLEELSLLKILPNVQLFQKQTRTGNNQGFKLVLFFFLLATKDHIQIFKI